MKLYNALKKGKFLILSALILFTASCSNDDNPTEAAQPAFENIEMVQAITKKALLAGIFILKWMSWLESASM